MNLERVEIGGWSNDSIAALMRELADAPYELGHGPLVRFVAGAVSADEHVILIASHHLVAHMWSLSMLGRELVGREGRSAEDVDVYPEAGCVL